MANSDYGQIRQEGVWVTRQTALGVQATAQSRDRVIVRGRVTLPSVLTERVPSEEIRETPDVDQMIARKKPPGEGEIPVYAKAPSTPGRLPQWAALALDVMGVEENVLEVLAFGALTGTTVTVTINGTPTVLTEGTEWTAATSNAATATSLATAIAAIAGVGATAVGAEVRVTRDDGTGEVALSTTAASTALALQEVRYRLATDILEKVLTITHRADNVVHVYRDCKTRRVAWEVSGTDEGTIRFGLLLGNEVFCGYHTLAAGVAASGDPVTLTFAEVPRLLLGPLATDTLIVRIDSEEFRLIPGTEDYSAKTVQASRAQNGTTAAAHAIGAVVEPVTPANDPDANDTILPMTLGTFTVGGTEYRLAEATVSHDEQIEARIDEWGEAAPTGYRRSLEGRVITIEFTAYQRRAVLDLLALAERGITQPVTLTLGKPGVTPQIIVSLPQWQSDRPQKGERGGEFARTFRGMGLASSAGNDGLAITVRAA
jgi:hypothetical protein